MSQHYVAAQEIEWIHPDDVPPPRGAKVLLYLHPNGVAIIGEFHKSGAALWAPLPKVSAELKQRLEAAEGSWKTPK